MQNPEIYVQKVKTGNEQELYSDLVLPFIEGDKDQISTYRLKQVVQNNTDTFAVYEYDHSIFAVQFYLDDKLLQLGNEEHIQFMSIDEIRLIRELGHITIDGMSFIIVSTTFNIINSVKGCQHIIIFNLKRNF